MVPQWIIEKKRDGQELTGKEISFFINSFTSGSIPDYQMSALAMAIYFQGMTPEETAHLTLTMMNSGEVLSLSSLTRPTCDKHSTGGIGDKVSLILAPLASACGIDVPMISGRGLGITGGTLDKLESIPGYRTDLTPTEFERIIADCGCSIIGQTSNLAPADRKLYALRDVTGTVPSIPLISASIMSKKLAEGARSLVLDVKWGSGAFMKTPEAAGELARSMIRIGASAERKVSALITNMNHPLGQTIGNALEVIESIETLKGFGPPDLVEITIALCAEMLLISGLSTSLDEAAKHAADCLSHGKALSVFSRMLKLHGGNTSVINDYSLLPSANHTFDILSRSAGFICSVDAEKIGKAALILGAGRKAVTDQVDHAVGISHLIKTGTPIKEGDLLMRLHFNDEKTISPAMELAAEACIISRTQPELFKLITNRIDGNAL